MFKYDAVVIGAGNGGLSAALTLASAGKKVLVVEQHNLPGGCATSFIRGRFEFDASLHEFCDIGDKDNPGDAGKLLMEEYKLPVTWYQIPDLFRVIGKTRSGKHIDVTVPCGVQECIDKISETVPGSRTPLINLFRLIEECIEASEYYYARQKSLGSQSTITPSKLLFAAKFTNFLKVAEKPFNEVLRKLDMPEDAIDILGTYWPYMGMDCEHISFIQKSFMLYMYIVNKPAICKYNSHCLSVAATERIRELGGDIWQNVKALKVCTDDNGSINGVRTTNGFVSANYVIANISPYTAYTKLLNRSVKIPKRELKRITVQEHSSSFLNIYLGLNRSVEELGIKDYTIFFPNVIDSYSNYKTSCRLDGNYYGTSVVYNVIDPDASPKGTTIMSISIEYNKEVWGDISQREYSKKKTEIAKKTIEAFEKETGIIIHDCIEEIEVATPWTFAHFLGTPTGSVYGYKYLHWDTMLSRMMMMKQDQPIRGFKTCGASGARGDGYSMTYTNGNDMAKLILEEMEEDGRNKK